MKYISRKAVYSSRTHVKQEYTYTVEPRLSEPYRRHTISSDKREVRIGGVDSEMTIGCV